MSHPAHGELEVLRQIFTDEAPHLLSTFRATTAPSPNPGDPDQKSYVLHLQNVPCQYVESGQLEQVRESRDITVRTSVILVPYGTDVTSDDLVYRLYGVPDEDGVRTQLNTKNLSILGVHRLDDHWELEIEELS